MLLELKSLNLFTLIRSMTVKLGYNDHGNNEYNIVDECETQFDNVPSKNIRRRRPLNRCNR